MKKTLSLLAGKVVVMTGASSGIGRAAAVQFAARGCRVALAARREPDLQITADLCRAAGGEALVVATDVTREADVQHLALTVMAAWRRIDVWVNNAGVTLFGLLSEAPFEEHRRVIEVNLFGAMLGARAAIPIFREQGHGVLLNVGSILSKVGQPFVPSYVISKYALRGLSDALRAEVAELPGVHVCTLLPYAVDTPHFQSAANVVGRAARALPPVQTPEKVARALVHLAARPRRERHVPKIMVAGLALHALFPRTTERLLLRALQRWHFDARPQRASTGNLHQPAEERAGKVHGQRGAQVGTARFAAWTVWQFALMEGETAWTRVLRARTNGRALRHGAV